MKKIVLSLFAFAAFSVSAQKASNKISFQKGQTLEISTNMNMTTQSMMGEMPATISMVEHYLVGDAVAGQAQLTKTMKNVKMNISAMGQEMKMDSDNPQDLEGQLGGPVKELLKQKQEFTVDASGMVTAVKVDEKNKKGDGGAGAMGMMMPGLNMGSGVPVVGQPSVFKILPARDVTKGDTWTDSVNTKDNQNTTVYTVKDITDTEIILDYTGQGKTKTTQSQMGMTMNVTADTKSSGTVTLDKATGLLKQRTMTANTESNISMGAGQEMATTTKMTVVTNIKTL